MKKVDDIDEVISVGILNTMWAFWNKKNLKSLEGKTVLVVNEKAERICAKIKFLAPPKKYTRTKVYRLDEKGGDKNATND